MAATAFWDDICPWISTPRNHRRTMGRCKTPGAGELCLHQWLRRQEGGPNNTPRNTRTDDFGNGNTSWISGTTCKLATSAGARHPEGNAKQNSHRRINKGNILRWNGQRQCEGCNIATHQLPKNPMYVGAKTPTKGKRVTGKQPHTRQASMAQRKQANGGTEESGNEEALRNAQ